MEEPTTSNFMIEKEGMISLPNTIAVFTDTATKPPISLNG